MPNLTLGTVEFYTDELPSEINLGGEQILAIRKFPGGGLDVQPLGAWDDPIAWEGTFMFTEALQRCVQVGMMRVNAKAVQMSISTISRMVMVTKFKYKYLNDYNIPYQIELQPLVSYGPGTTVNGISIQGANAPVAAASSTAAASTASASPDTQTKQPQQSHIVASKDTLWGLAVKFYSSGAQWTRIAQANGIKNPGTLEIGQKLIIPT